MQFESIKDKIRVKNYRFSDHAVKRMIKRSINRSEVEQAVLRGEIVEEYPDDKYSPSCLVYGKTTHGRDLHVQVTEPPVVIVTAYEPEDAEWIECRTRRK